MAFLKEKSVFVCFCSIVLLFLPFFVVYLEETLSVILFLLLLIVLIYQVYDLILESVKSQIIVMVLKFKYLYFYLYLNFYLNLITAFCVLKNSLQFGLSAIAPVSSLFISLLP